ncbi:uncharacterized protein LOC141886465 isoform X4 [Acropora palmata]|uniref:uncharacterized protein LOC141886465 isoform X4 n=1 Tax=Acropora palmata TaxID=6131 RepID=UPI003DA0D86F
MELRVSGIQSHYAGKCVPTILELNWNQRGKVTQRLVNAWRDLRRRAQVNMRRPRANRVTIPQSSIQHSIEPMHRREFSVS